MATMEQGSLPPAELKRLLALRQARLSLLLAAEHRGEMTHDHATRRAALEAEVVELEAALGVQLSLLGAPAP